MKLLKYLYYKFYKLSLIVDIDKIPEWKAYFLFSGLLMTNLWILAKLIDKYIYSFAILEIVSNKWSYYIIFSIVFGFNYIIFLKGKKYLEIIKQFETETDIQRKMGNIGLFVYIVISVVLIFVVWIK